MPPLSYHFDFPLSPEQQAAVLQMVDFFTSGDEIFILRGHAGTGKTSLVKGLIKYLESEKIPSRLMASTGRAAKVLSMKTGLKAETMHRYIYTMNLHEIDEKTEKVNIDFKLRQNQDTPQTIYFVDESSMISDQKSLNVSLNFGSGKLLTDMLFFAAKRKIVFIGDPAQLPPVNYLYSPALNPDYFVKHFGKQVSSFSLKGIHRFGSETGIGRNVKDMQQKINELSFPYLSIRVTGNKDMHICPSEEALARTYAESIHKLGIDNCIMLSFSNKMANSLNQQVRQKLFGRNIFKVNEGELLIVIQNNYKHSLYNGDHLEILEVSDSTETRAGIVFRNVKARALSQGTYLVFEGKVIDTLLNGDALNLDARQDFELMRDFFIRAHHLGIKRNSPDFNNFMLSDPYLNALRVKYGYAITCHKAQGGEWQHVFVALEPVLFVQDKQFTYRWVYTAVSRTMNEVYFLQNRCIY
jgi:ATP-dependent exoDNAse (exonuclease V) alpha subunit